MKILHLNQNLAPKGGVETYLIGLLPLLRELGIENHVGYQEGDGALWPESTCIRGLKSTGFSSIKYARLQVKSLLQQIKPDLVHIHNVNSIGVHQACLLSGIPTVMTSHDFRTVCPADHFYFRKTREVCQKDGPDLGCFTTTLQKHCLTPRPQYAFYYFYRAKWLVNHSAYFHQVIAPSQNTMERLSRAGYPKENISVIPYFCSFHPAPSIRPIPEKPTITFIGRIAPNKGQEFFIEALGKLPGHFQGIIVGSYTEAGKQQMEAQARALGCLERLTFHPWATREEITGILDRTSVFVFPSLWPETLGIVGLEAMARGVPVVASDIGGVPEWLWEGTNGFLARPKSSDDIVKGVLKLTASHESLRQYGEAALQTIHQKFLPQIHTKKLTDLYAQTINKSNS